MSRTRSRWRWERKQWVLTFATQREFQLSFNFKRNLDLCFLMWKFKIKWKQCVVILCVTGRTRTWGECTLQSSWTRSVLISFQPNVESSWRLSLPLSSSPNTRERNFRRLWRSLTMRSLWSSTCLDPQKWSGPIKTAHVSIDQSCERSRWFICIPEKSCAR